MTTKNNKLFITGFILPCIIVLLVVYFYPVMRTIFMSFFKTGTVTDPVEVWKWTGIGNYKHLMQSKDFILSVTNMLKLFLIGGVLTVAISILLGVLISAKNNMPGRNFFRTIIYMPNMISTIAIGNAFYYFVFAEDYGMMDSLWKFFGADPIQWMKGDNRFYAMMIAILFCGVGYYMLVMISGIESIPDDLYEAAVLDGAGPFQKFWHITLPLMKGTIRTIITFWSISALQMFAWNQVFTPVGTNAATISPIVYMYEILFGGSFAETPPDAGLGASIGVFTAVLTQVIYTILNKLLSNDDLEF